MISRVTHALALLLCIASQPAYSAFAPEPAIAPFSFAVFCARQPAECQPHSDARRPQLTSPRERWRQLNDVNRLVNRAILAKSEPASPSDYEWLIFPAAGRCADYAVTKRHLLLRAGWPSSSLQLAEVVLHESGEHHLILIVKEAGASFVLDNLNGAIERLPDVLNRYSLARIESAQDPQVWFRPSARS